MKTLVESVEVDLRFAQPVVFVTTGGRGGVEALHCRDEEQAKGIASALSGADLAAAELAARADERKKCFEEMIAVAAEGVEDTLGTPMAIGFRELMAWAAAKRDEGEAP